MTRNKDTESHERTATEQELKIAEKAREIQIEIEEESEAEDYEKCQVFLKSVTQE